GSCLQIFLCIFQLYKCDYSRYKAEKNQTESFLSNTTLPPKTLKKTFLLRLRLSV
ncbi:hypothetical protein KIL84_001389, partial [Mauremys mutica]